TGGGRRSDIENLKTLLTEARQNVSAAQGTMYELLSDRVAKLDDCEGLPAAIVHPDFSAANVIITPSGDSMLVDWTAAGRGPRILSLGTLLLCSGGDEKVIRAIVEGYTKHVRLEAEEVDRLPDAIRGFSLIIDSWTAIFRPKMLERIMSGRAA